MFQFVVGLPFAYLFLAPDPEDLAIFWSLMNLPIEDKYLYLVIILVKYLFHNELYVNVIWKYVLIF